MECFRTEVSRLAAQKGQSSFVAVALKNFARENDKIALGVDLKT